MVSNPSELPSANILDDQLNPVVPAQGEVDLSSQLLHLRFALDAKGKSGILSRLPDRPTRKQVVSVLIDSISIHPMVEDFRRVLSAGKILGIPEPFGHVESLMSDRNYAYRMIALQALAEVDDRHKIDYEVAVKLGGIMEEKKKPESPQENNAAKRPRVMMISDDPDWKYMRGTNEHWNDPIRL